jgi:hypothetical protein
VAVPAAKGVRGIVGREQSGRDVAAEGTHVAVDADLRPGGPGEVREVCSARGGKAVARLAGEPSPSCAPQVHCAIHVLAPGDVNAAVGPNGRAVASGAGGELDVRTRRRPAVATCAGPLRRQRVVRLLGIRPRRRGPLTAEDGWVGPVTVDAGATHLRRVPCRFRAPGRGKWAPGEKRAGKVTRRGEGGRDSGEGGGRRRRVWSWRSRLPGLAAERGSHRSRGRPCSSPRCSRQRDADLHTQRAIPAPRLRPARTRSVTGLPNGRGSCGAHVTIGHTPSLTSITWVR